MGVIVSMQIDHSTLKLHEAHYSQSAKLHIERSMLRLRLVGHTKLAT